MFEANKPRKLIIVCDDKTKPYANYLMALISAKDDKEDEVIGVRDGSVEAVVWSEKDFANNEPTLSSNAHVLFIGDTKLSKTQRGGLGIKFNQYGMQYGWLGKRAVLFVDRTITNAVEYNGFYDFAVPYQESMTKVIERKTQKMIAAGTVLEVDEKEAKMLQGGGKAGKVGIAALAAGVVAPVIPVAAAAVATPFAIAKGMANIKEKKEVLQQQYSCLAMVFYLEGLNDFLEG